MKNKQIKAKALVMIVSALFYAAIAVFSVNYFFVNDITVVWPAGALMCAFYLVYSRRNWWWLTIGFAGGYALNLYLDEGPFNLVQLGYFVANVCSSIFCAYLYRSICGGRITFENFKQVNSYILVLCILHALINASIAFAFDSIAISSVADIERAAIWFVSNCVSFFVCIMLFYFTIILFSSRHSFLHPKIKQMLLLKNQKFELALFLMVTSCLLFGVFPHKSYSIFLLGFIFVLFPMAMWMSLRFSTFIWASWTAYVYFICVFITASHLGPFNYIFNDFTSSIIYMQLFFFMAFSTSLVIGAINFEKDTKSRMVDKLNAQLRVLSQVDHLTQIANRRRYDEVITKELTESTRKGLPLALLAIDIDYFKLYNDKYGHLAGDECLVKIAAAIEKNLDRSTDMVARMGGEEFFCVLPDTDKDGAEHVMCKIQSTIAELNILHETSPIADRVTVSMGACIRGSSDEANKLALYKFADKTLYSAKVSGRNRFLAKRYSECA